MRLIRLHDMHGLRTYGPTDLVVRDVLETSHQRISYHPPTKFLDNRFCQRMSRELVRVWRRCGEDYETGDGGCRVAALEEYARGACRIDYGEGHVCVVNLADGYRSRCCNDVRVVRLRWGRIDYESVAGILADEAEYEGAII